MTGILALVLLPWMAAFAYRGYPPLFGSFVNEDEVSECRHPYRPLRAAMSARPTIQSASGIGHSSAVIRATPRGTEAHSSGSGT
jgi:hypothetical protein